MSKAEKILLQLSKKINKVRSSSGDIKAARDLLSYWRKHKNELKKIKGKRFVEIEEKLIKDKIQVMLYKKYRKKYQGVIFNTKDLSRDAKLKALPPGKRKSKSGKIYYEYRSNRSDTVGGI